MIATRDHGPQTCSGSGARPPAPLRPTGDDDKSLLRRGKLAATGGEADPDAVEGMDPIQAATLLPAHLLQGGEIIILLLKPSPWFIVLDSLKSLAIIAVSFAILLTLQNQAVIAVSRRDLLIAGIAVIGVRLFWQFLEWLSRVYVLTDRRLIRVRGVLRVQVFETSIQNIQHTEVYLSIRERIFGLGTIGFATAGTALNEAYWRMIAAPMEVHQIVVQAINRYKR